MKTQPQTGTIKIWFGLLKLAIGQGLLINEDVYRSWGTREELRNLTFNRWWRDRGKVLFEESIPKVTLVRSTDQYVTVQIPTSITAVQVKQQVSELVAKQRGTKRLKIKPPLAFIGDVNYKRLKQYERYLEIEFDPRNAGKTVEEKTELLRNVYRRIKIRLDKQRVTLKGSGKIRVARRLFYRDPDSFGSKAEIRKGIEAKKVNRWKLSGQILLLNVAEGQFPGRNYYGAQLAKKLKGRLELRGMKRIGGSVQNKGGGRTKQDLTLVRVRNSKVQLDAQSLKAYGKGKGSNPMGGAE